MDRQPIDPKIEEIINFMKKRPSNSDFYNNLCETCGIREKSQKYASPNCTKCISNEKLRGKRAVEREIRRFGNTVESNKREEDMAFAQMNALEKAQNEYDESERQSATRKEVLQIYVKKARESNKTPPKKKLVGKKTLVPTAQQVPTFGELFPTLNQPAPTTGQPIITPPPPSVPQQNDIFIQQNALENLLEPNKHSPRSDRNPVLKPTKTIMEAASGSKQDTMDIFIYDNPLISDHEKGSPTKKRLLNKTSQPVEDLDRELDQIEIDSPVNLFEELMDLSSEHTTLFCKMCENLEQVLENGILPAWIRHDPCGHIFHYKCVAFAEKTGDKKICPVCEKSYTASHPL